MLHCTVQEHATCPLSTEFWCNPEVQYCSEGQSHGRISVLSNRDLSYENPVSGHGCEHFELETFSFHVEVKIGEDASITLCPV